MQITFNPLDTEDFNRVVTFMQAMGAIQTMVPAEQSDAPGPGVAFIGGGGAGGGGGAAAGGGDVTPPTTVAEAAVQQTEVAQAAVAPELDPRIGLELDANGTPWLEAVHAGTRKQDKDGVWKKRRGVDDDVKLKAEAEARERLAATPAAGAVPNEAVAAAVPNEAVADAVASPDNAFPTAAPVVETVPGMPGMPNPQAPGTPPPPCTLEELGGVYSMAVDAGVVTSETIMDVYSEAGLATPSEIQTDDAKRARVAQILRVKMGIA